MIKDKDSALLLSSVETIEYWRDAYSNPASGEHFHGHGMVVHLLGEYAEFRKKALCSLSPDSLPGLIASLEAGLASLKKTRHVDMVHSQAELAIEAQLDKLKSLVAQAAAQ